MTTTTSRRAILAGAAALPIAAVIPPAAAIEVPADPVFELIERHRRAFADLDAAYHALNKAEDERPSRPYSDRPRLKLGRFEQGEFERADGGNGTYTLTYRPTGKFTTIYATSPDEVERNVPRKLSKPEQDAWITSHLAKLSRKQAKAKRLRKKTKIGQLEAEAARLCDAEDKVAWELVSTVPATLSGARARLDYVRGYRHPTHTIADDRPMMWALLDTTEAVLWSIAGLSAPESLDLKFEAEDEERDEIVAA